MALENVFYRALTEIGTSSDTAEKVVDLLKEEISMTTKNHVLEAIAPIMAQLATSEANLLRRVDSLESRMKGWFQAVSVIVIVISAIAAIVGVLKAFGKI
jgi:hypothetical protein